ncbi:MAG: succinate--CoA ligase subunit alpha [Elusimicrobia bacterium]|nr:succinate--CoA ligase subunit alpha [Elusimicrobiota bacterium]
MSVLINKDSRVLVSGMTGKEGTYHSQKMIDLGTKVVCGVTPGKGGIKHLGVPVYDSVQDALAEHEVDACGIFVPSRFAMNAASEAIEAGIEFVVVITEGICPHETLRFISRARDKECIVLGPNTPGLLTPRESIIGVLATDFVKKGNIGVISRSGTLTVEICYYLLKEGFGQSTIVGLGGDAVVGSTFKDVYMKFLDDEETEGIVIVGEIGGTMEEELAAYIKSSGRSKPTVAFIAGRNAPEGKRLGHAGAIIEGGMGSAESKIKSLEDAGVLIADVPWETGILMKEVSG